MTHFSIDTLCTAARADLAAHVNRSAAQHKRRMLASWARRDFLGKLSRAVERANTDADTAPVLAACAPTMPITFEGPEPDDVFDDALPLDMRETLFVWVCMASVAMAFVGMAALVSGLIAAHL